jgi:Thiol-disulfide isomerase and thioredoxins
MKNNKTAATIFGAILLCGLFLNGCADKQSVPQSPQKTDAAPQSEENVQETDSADGILQSFTANTLDGGTYTQENFSGTDVTIINFWATFCGPCLAEMPDIAAFEKSLPENVQMITVCLDGAGNTDGVKSILEEAGYEGTTLLDGDGDFASVCGEILYIPTTILVDQHGNMIGDAIIGGQQDLEETYKAAVNDALLALGKAEIGDEN